MTDRENLKAFWLYLIAWQQAREIERLELRAICCRNAARRRERMR